jgi:hypothetical protein
VRVRATEEERRRVGARVAYAVRTGKLVRQPCEVCGLEPFWYRPQDRPWSGYASVVAHHDDYDKPLEVRWLCRFHHAEHHRVNGSYAQNGRKRGVLNDNGGKP